MKIITILFILFTAVISTEITDELEWLLMEDEEDMDIKTSKHKSVKAIENWFNKKLMKIIFIIVIIFIIYVKYKNYKINQQRKRTKKKIEKINVCLKLIGHIGLMIYLFYLIYKSIFTENYLEKKIFSLFLLLVLDEEVLRRLINFI